MRVLLLAVVLAFASGCATSAATTSTTSVRRIGKATEADRKLVAEVRDQAAALLQGQAELFWEAWTKGTPVDVEAHYASHEALFTATRFEAVQRVRAAEKDPDGRRALHFLESWLAGEILARSTAEHSTRLAGIEAAATFGLDGEKHGWRELEPMLAAEADPERRAAMQQAALPVLHSLGEVLHAKRERLEAVARTLGYESTLDAAAALRQSSPAAIDALAGGVLAATDGLHTKAFTSLARRQLGTELGALRRSDMPRLFSSLGLFVRFPSADALPALEATLQGLGLDASALRVEPRAPSGRPLALAVAPPQDVRLALPAAARDWAPIFHEAGLALHAAHTAPGAFEHALLGNEASAEAFAVLFENLTTNPAWLRDQTGMTAAEAAAHASTAAARRLYQARRHAARLGYQIAWANGVDQPRALYRAAMERAYGFPLSGTDAAWYAVDQDEWLFGADALRAWMLAAMIEEHLVAAHGEAWWLSAEAGRALAALMESGNRETPDEIAQRIGAKALDPQAFVRQLEGRLGVLLTPPPAPAAKEAEAAPAS
ncbi:hypothetical protein [Vulgatibacter sp.]|uniref:hypothetical protein n=1 Tax=Vulgatibacter sp. TaxID=1971226 RepID=UPI003563F15D